MLSDSVSKKFGIINKKKNIQKFDIYIPITNHKKIISTLQKLVNKKTIIEIFK